MTKGEHDKGEHDKGGTWQRGNMEKIITVIDYPPYSWNISYLENVWLIGVRVG